MDNINIMSRKVRFMVDKTHLLWYNNKKQGGAIMERKIYKDLVAWKNSSDRKPLILQGARQVGKTYIVNYFAGEEYNNNIYCNFERDKGLHDFFKDLTPATIIKKLSL